MSVDLKALIKSLKFDEENLPATLAEHPMLFLESVRYRIEKMRERITAESVFESKCAAYSLLYRANKTIDKLTESAIKDKVAINKNVKEFKAAYDTKLAGEEYAKLLMEVFRVRGHCLKALVDIFLAEGSVDIRKERSKIEKRGFDSMASEVEEKWNT